MSSDFGADIFSESDDPPPSQPPPAGRKPEDQIPRTEGESPRSSDLPERFESSAPREDADEGSGPREGGRRRRRRGRRGGRDTESSELPAGDETGFGARAETPPIESAPENVIEFETTEPAAPPEWRARDAAPEERRRGESGESEFPEVRTPETRLPEGRPEGRPAEGRMHEGRMGEGRPEGRSRPDRGEPGFERGGEPRRDRGGEWRGRGDRGPDRGGADRGFDRGHDRGHDRGGRGPERHERERFDRPQGDRPQGDRPQGDRPQGDRPQGDRPQGDRPGFDRDRPPRMESRPDIRPPQRPQHGMPMSPHAGPAGARGPEQRDVRPVAVPGTSAQRVAMFVDVEHLIVEARQLGGEVSYNRVLRSLSGQRALVRAVAYVGESHRALVQSLHNGGFEVELVDDARGSAVALATDAVTVAPRVDCIVLAPESTALCHLARTLRAQGVRVETAGFNRGLAEKGRAVGQHHHQLGKECLFVP